MGEVAFLEVMRQEESIGKRKAMIFKCSLSSSRLCLIPNQDECMQWDVQKLFLPMPRLVLHKGVFGFVLFFILFNDKIIS